MWLIICGIRDLPATCLTICPKVLTSYCRMLVAYRLSYASPLSYSGCLEAGYEDFNQCRSDPDLAALRADSRFAELMLRFEPKKPQGFFGGLFQGFKS